MIFLDFLTMNIISLQTEPFRRNVNISAQPTDALGTTQTGEARLFARQSGSSTLQLDIRRRFCGRSALTQRQCPLPTHRLNGKGRGQFKACRIRLCCRSCAGFTDSSCKLIFTMLAKVSYFICYWEVHIVELFVWLISSRSRRWCDGVPPCGAVSMHCMS